MSLTTPLFLCALAAVAIPLWIHLSRKQKHKPLLIGTLRFMEEILKERRKRARLEDIPLLPLRLLAVALLAFLFARPYLSRDRDSTPPAMQTVILLDASGSITAEMAKEAVKSAEKAAQEFSQGKVILGQFSDQADLLSQLEDYQPRAGSPTRLAKALDWALGRLEGVSEGKSARVVLISHLAAADLPSTPPRLWPPNVEVQVRSLAAPALENSAVLGVSLLTPYTAELMEVEVVVSLAAKARREVVLAAEGLRIAAPVPAGSDRVVIAFKPPRAEVRGTVTVASGDPWPVDDSRPFAVSWLQPRKVLLVDGNPGSTPFEGQAFFVHKALTASGAAHGKTPFQPEIVNGLGGRNGTLDLTGYAAVGLFGVTDLSAAEARTLAAFVAQGGGLISVLDHRWEPLVTKSLEDNGLFPTELARTDGPDLRHAAAWNKAHPILAGFDGREGGDFTTLAWRDAYDLRASGNWSAVASLDGGHVLLAERVAVTGSKDGPVLALAHPLTRQWGDLPWEPLFVPFVKKLFAHVARAETARPELPPLAPGLLEKRAPGHYQTADLKTIVVAADATESLTAGASEESFRTAFGLPAPGLVLPPPAASEKDPASRFTWRYELWPWAALILLLLLIVETLAATRKPSPARA